jgi:hypothetical protein
MDYTTASDVQSGLYDFGAGGYSQTLPDTIGQYLNVYANYENIKLNSRLQETRMNMAALEATARMSNPQANAASYTTPTGGLNMGNPLVMVGILGGLGVLAYLALK